MARHLDTFAIGNQQAFGLSGVRLMPAFIILITIVMSMIIWSEVTGVRGVDQYWYLSDTQTLIDGGEPLTNTVFPGMVLRRGGEDITTHFLHNGPILHINALIGEYTGAFNAWKLSNLVLLVITATLVGATAARLASPRWGYCAYLIYLLSPLAIWQTANLFQESFLAFLTAGLLYLLTLARRHAATREAAAVLLFIGILCHPAYLCLAICFLAWLIHERTRIVRILLISAAFVIAKVLQPYLFPSSFQPDLMTIITSSSIEHATNMMWHLSDFPVELSLKETYHKVIQGARHQFLNLNYVPLMIVSNLGLVGFVVLLIHRRQQYRALLVASFLLYGVVAGMIVLMQNAPRYQLIMAPAATLCMTLGLAFLPVRWSGWPVLRTAAIAIGLLAFAIADYRMVQYVKDTVQIESESTDVLMDQLEHLPVDVRIALVDHHATERYIPLITALSPRPVMPVEPQVMTEAGLRRVLELYQPDIIITAVPELFTYADGKVLDILPDGFYGSQTLFHTNR